MYLSSMTKIPRKEKQGNVTENNSKAMGAGGYQTNTWVLFLMCRDCYCKDRACRCGIKRFCKSCLKRI